MKMNDNNLLLGKTIRRLRKLKQLSQEDLGDLSGTGINFVSQLELGKKTVRLDKLLSVLRVLGLQFFLRRGKETISVSGDL